VLPQIRAEIASGRLDGQFNLRTEAEGSPFSVEAAFTNVDLNRLVVDGGGMPGQAGGKIGATIRLSGESANTDTITGGGRMTIENAAIRQYELLQVLGNALQIPELARLEVQQGEMNYRVGDSKVFIDQLTLQSPNLKLSATGKVKFNGRLDLQARLTLNERLSRQLPGFIEANFSRVENSTDRYVDFKVTGPMDKPKTNLVEQIIGKRYEDQAVGLLKDIFGIGSKKPDQKKPATRATSPTPSPSPVETTTE